MVEVRFLKTNDRITNGNTPFGNTPGIGWPMTSKSGDPAWSKQQIMLRSCDQSRKRESAAQRCCDVQARDCPRLSQIERRIEIGLFMHGAKHCGTACISRITFRVESRRANRECFSCRSLQLHLQGQSPLQQQISKPNGMPLDCCDGIEMARSQQSGIHSLTDKRNGSLLASMPWGHVTEQLHAETVGVDNANTAINSHEMAGRARRFRLWRLITNSFRTLGGNSKLIAILLIGRVQRSGQPIMNTHNQKLKEES